MNELIKYFNKKYGEKYGKIAYPRTTLQIYQVYQIIKSSGIEDEKLNKLLNETILPKPKTTEEKEAYAECVYESINVSASRKYVDNSLRNKVDKVNGKGLSTVDFTTAYETKLKKLENYNDTTIKKDIETINTQLGNIAKKLEQGGTGGSSDADKITIKDESNHFTSTNVEGALSELFQSASNGKKLIATAITGRGVETSNTDSFQTMATNINTLSIINPNVVEFSQMNDLVTSYLADAESKYTNSNGDTVSVIANYGTSEGKKDRPLGYEISNTTGSIFVQNEKTGFGYTIPNPIGSKHSIYNAVPGEVSQYILKNSSNQILENLRIKPTGRVRMINFIGYVNNFRDIGGWSCNGGTVKYGKIFRSGVISSIENIDKQVVKSIHLKHQIDLREPSETNNMSESPFGLNVRYENYPFSLYYNEAIDISGANHTNMKNLFRKIFDCVVHDEPLVYHCSLGRDRTGTVTFMLMALLGVERKYIDMDYELSAFSSIGSNAPRTLTNYRSLATYLATLGGSTLLDNVVWWFLKSGFDINELNTFRNAMIDGTPTQLDVSDYTVAYSVTNSLIGCANSNTATSVIENSNYSGTLSFIENYNTWKSVTISMGGVDITSTAYSNGNISISKVTGNVVITAVAEYKTPYTNQIPLSTDASGALFNNGKGWKPGFKLQSGDGTEEENASYEVTGFIPCSPTDVFRIKNVDFDVTTGYNNICFYDSNHTFLKAFAMNSKYNPMSQWQLNDGSIEGSISNITTSNITEAQKQQVAYLRLSAHVINDSSIITINEEIVG